MRLNRTSYLAPVPIVSTDEHDRASDFNLASRVLLGDEFARFHGRPLREFFHWLDADWASNGITELSSQESRSRCARFVSRVAGPCELRVCSVPELSTHTGAALGATVYMSLHRVTERDRFDGEWRERCERELTWERYAISYDRILLEMPYYQEVLHRHFDALQGPGIRRVIDIGAGTGNLAVRLLRSCVDVTFVDNSRAMVDRFRYKLDSLPHDRLTILEQDGESLNQLDAEYFDGVSILLALFDMGDPEQCLAEAIRVLKTGGRIVITEPKQGFCMDPILRFVKEHLRERGLFDDLREDVERLFEINARIDPASRASHSPLRAEVIAEKLERRGFHEIASSDSHFGNCATVRAIKAQGATRERLSR